MKNLEIATFVLSIISILLAVISAVHSIYVYIQTVKHDKKQATLDAFNILQEQVLDKINLYSNSKIKEIAEDARSKEYRELTILMARIEHFSVGVNTEIYDLKIVKRLAGKHFCMLFDKLRPMIEKKRKINKTDKHYDEFEKLVEELNCLYQK